MRGHSSQQGQGTGATGTVCFYKFNIVEEKLSSLQLNDKDSCYYCCNKMEVFCLLLLVHFCDLWSNFLQHIAKLE